MITPAYAPTATERVLPRLALDFTTGVLDPRVTVSRALNTATRTDASGLIQLVNADLPRFDYDPVTLAPRGILIEEQRANLFTYSEQFDNAAWISTALNLSANSTTSPDGTNSADLLIPTTASAQHYNQSMNVSQTAGTAYTTSIYAKANGYNFLRVGPTNTSVIVCFDLQSGTVSAENTAGAGKISSVGNGWYRCSVTATASATTNGSVYFSVNNASSLSTLTFAGNGTSGIYLWGAQIEAGAFATSYIPTTTTSLTRNADVVTMTGTNFSSWYNATEGSFYAQGSRVSDTSYAAYVSVSDGTTTNEIYITEAVNYAQAYIRSSGGAAGDLTVAQIWPLGSVRAAVAAYKSNQAALAYNGNAVVQDTAVDIPTVNKMNIGSRGSNATFINGRVAKIFYWPVRLTNAEIQAFSK